MPETRKQRGHDLEWGQLKDEHKGEEDRADHTALLALAPQGPEGLYGDLAPAPHPIGDSPEAEQNGHEREVCRARQKGFSQGQDDERRRG